MGHHRAKGILLLFAVERQIKGFERAQRHRHAGRRAESLLVFAIKFRTSELINQGLICIHQVLQESSFR